MDEQILIPFIVYGDGPRLPSGLARIAKDITTRLFIEQEALGIQLAQVGVDYPGGWHWQAWDFCGFQPSPGDQGREAVKSVVDELAAKTGQRPIVLMFMDPSRCYDLLRAGSVPVDAPESEIFVQADFWGYFPIDAHNQQGTVGGPAGQAIHDSQRILAYGKYGAGVLKRTLIEQRRARDAQEAYNPAVAYLPHGIDTHTFTTGRGLDQASDGFRTWAVTVPADVIKIGCVATNQARKDLGLLFTAVASVKRAGYPVALWLHTDKLTHIWDVGELARTCGFLPHEIAVSIDEENDVQLAARYCWSDVTVAPGLGEGFGYPIVESLACGTPVIHGNYAGGVELLPNQAWLIDPVAWRLESLYALQRPVYHPKDFAETIIRTARIAIEAPAVSQAYCRGSVAHLDWVSLWPRWRAWIAKGLEEVRDARGDTPTTPAGNGASASAVEPSGRRSDAGDTGHDHPGHL